MAIQPFKVNVKIADLLKKFILSGGFEIRERMGSALDG
jgi:hypothetical protein